MSDLTYAVATPDCQPELAEVLSASFHFEPEQSARWVRETGIAAFRTVRQAGQLVGGLMIIPSAQWYLGRPVTLAGVAGVAIAPTARGRGVAKTMMAQLLRELHQDGVALSALYASTMGLYRGVGYGPAGCRCRFRVPLKHLRHRQASLEVHAERPQDAPELEAWQAQQRQTHGALVRSPYHWRRLRAPRGQATTGYLFRRQGALVANCRYLKSRSPAGEMDLELTDLFAQDAEAAQEVLGFLSAHQSLCREVCWFGGPSSPWLSFLEDRLYRAEILEEWMLRLVHLPAAFEQRGYPATLSGQARFRVLDPILAENQRAWRLEVSQGQARCHPEADQADLPEVTIGTLAGLTSGHLTADQAILTGGLRGPREATQRLAQLLLAPAPDLPDFF